MPRLITYGLCLALLLSTAAARAQEADDEKVRSLLDGRVTFALPAAWSAKSHVSTATQGNVQIGLPTLNRKAAEPIVGLSAKKVEAGVGVRHLSDGVYKNRFEGLAVLSDTFDGEDWRTMVWTAKSEAPFVALQRFGVFNRVAVEVFVLFHLPEGGDPRPLEKVFAEFNALCESLKVDGRNRFEHKTTPDKIAGHFKVTNR